MFPRSSVKEIDQNWPFVYEKVIFHRLDQQENCDEPNI